MDQRSAAFLSASQKRDILYNNAARFLGLEQLKPATPGFLSEGA
jgi:hypothetical protein